MIAVLNDTERRVFTYLADRISKDGMGSLESTGVSEHAIKKGVVHSLGSWANTLTRLKKRDFIDSTFVGRRLSLYVIGQAGLEWIQEHGSEALRQSILILKEDKLTNSVKRATVPTTGRSIGEQLQAHGITAQSYTAPVGIALPKTGTYSEDVNGVIAFYKERINAKPTENELERLNEWYEKLETEGRPAFHWLQEAIAKTSVKVKAEQRTIAYMIGIVKSWRLYGYGTDFGAEQRKLFNVFEKRFGYVLSPSARTKFMEALDAFGLVDVMSAMFETPVDEGFDPAMYYVNKLFETLNNQ